MASMLSGARCAVLCAAAPLAAMAQTAPAERVVVTGTRTEAVPFRVPASITRVDGDEVRDGHALVNLSDSLAGVPGLTARDRQNYAQDVQISVRGFGARSTFGIRGVRLYVDGIPATLPDGQGQITNVELGSVGRIEVLRGPFSALYGNSSGGVIQVFTADGAAPPSVALGVGGGSDGARRIGVQARGASGELAYNVSGSRFRTDGYRAHSAVERTLGNARLSWQVDGDTRLTLLANSVGLPNAQDPLGLTRAQYEADPRGVDASAIDFDTRKSVNQTQFGAILDHRVDGAGSLQAMVYGGHRGTRQFQSIPRASQASALSPGGVIVLGRDYEGGDLRWTTRAQAMGGPLTLVGGVSLDRLAEHRLGYQNFAGTAQGVQGALRRDENNDVTSFDQYLQLQWQPSARWTLNAGLRHSRVGFASVDRYVTAGNPDDSGSAAYTATLPVAGVLFALSEAVHLYVTAGRGFETPTLNELAYRSSGQTGLNFALQAARSTNVEAGVKLRGEAWGEITAAAFRVDTEREIVTQTNLGGRSTYQNAGATQRTGLELGWAATFWADLRAQLAATWLDATYRDAFLVCTATPCATPNVTIPAGNRIPGVSRGSAFASLAWVPAAGWRGGVEARWVSGVPVNDANTDAAPRYAVVSANLGYTANVGAWSLSGFVRGDNLFDRRYAGSVIVNEGNGRFFEPAPGRTGWLSAQASARF